MMCTHSFNIRHQYVTCKNKKESLAVDEVLLHVDFAENWVCKGLCQMFSSACPCYTRVEHDVPITQTFHVNRAGITSESVIKNNTLDLRLAE